MTGKLFGLIASCGISFLGLLTDAQAIPVDVSGVLSGSPGDWTYNFSLTNNLTGTNNVYALSVFISDVTNIGQTASWFLSLYSSSQVQWCNTDPSCYSPGNFAPGETISEPTPQKPSFYFASTKAKNPLPNRSTITCLRASGRFRFQTSSTSAMA